MRKVLGILAAAGLGLAALIPELANMTVKLAGTLPVLFSVLIGAIFIRLARGFPAIPYEKLAQSQALRATQAYRALVRAYVFAFLVFGLGIIANLVTHSLYASDVGKSPTILSVFLLALNFEIILAASWIVRSDFRLSMIQTDLIDDVTSQNAVSAARETQRNVEDALGGRETPSITRL